MGLAAWLGLLGAAVVGLHAMGGTLSPPPIHDPTAIGPWVGQREPPEVVFAGLRLLALGLAWYLLFVTGAGVVARSVGRCRVVEAVDVFTLPALHRLLNGALGLSLVTTLAGSPLSNPAHGQGPGTGAAPDALPTMQRLPQPVPTTPARAPAPTTTTTTRQWTVRSGDHFWAVAERVLAEAWQQEPSDAQVLPYWRALVAANTGRLRDPGNPDLLFPGQVLVVPAPPIER